MSLNLSITLIFSNSEKGGIQENLIIGDYG